MKRMFDFTVSLLMIIILMPLLLAISLVILIDAGHPIIFRQYRVGKDNKLFYIYKFRTMKNGTGNKANAIVATHTDPNSSETLAQCQESGRDQGHATLDVTLMGVLCQTAQNAGIGDLFTTYKALEMAEYVAKYNIPSCFT